MFITLTLDHSGLIVTWLKCTDFQNGLNLSSYKSPCWWILALHLILNKTRVPNGTSQNQVVYVSSPRQFLAASKSISLSNLPHLFSYSSSFCLGPLSPLCITAEALGLISEVLGFHALHQTLDFSYICLPKWNPSACDQDKTCSLCFYTSTTPERGSGVASQPLWKLQTGLATLPHTWLKEGLANAQS